MHMDDSVELIDFLSGVVTSGDSNGVTLYEITALWVHKHYVIRPFFLCGEKVLNPALTRPPKQKTKTKQYKKCTGMYHRCQAQEVSAKFPTDANEISWKFLCK